MITITFCFFNSQTGMWEKFLEATEEKPWLWVVVVACIFIPIVLLVYCCTGPSKVRRLFLGISF